jgi:hypothetical protein
MLQIPAEEAELGILNPEFVRMMSPGVQGQYIPSTVLLTVVPSLER